MALCEFSEFSFGYALTDSLVNAFRNGLGVAPVFANQVAEGKPGGGYDMKLPLNPVPMFFQFKIPSVMTRASKHMPSGYSKPYYRMALRTSKPNQHQLLVDLAKTQPLVYYATPLFDRVADLDSCFMSKSVQARCAFIRPSTIGKLDSQPHHVSYRKDAPYWVHSDPKRIEGEHDFESLLKDVRAAASKAKGEEDKLEFGRSEISSDAWTERRRSVLVQINEWLARNVASDFYPSRRNDEALRALLERAPGSPSEMARKLGYVSQVHYGLALAFVDANVEK